MVPAVSAPPAPSEDHLGREPGPKDPLPNPSLPSCACLPCDLGLAPFRSSLASPGRCGSQPRTGSSLPEAGRAGVGPLSSLWNGSKSGWGEWARAEEIVAVVGVQLGQIGPYSAAEKEALSSAKQPPWDPAPNSIIFISLCPRLLEVGVEVGHGCPPFHPPLPPTPNNRVHAGRELLKGTGQGREEGPGRVCFNMLFSQEASIFSWLQSPSAVILEPQKIKSDTVSTVSPSISHEMMGLDAMIFIF